MKNELNYYYGLTVSTIHQKNKMFYFNYEGNEYVFTKYDNINEIEEIYRLSNLLLQNNIYSHQIIPNIFKQLLTKINDDNFVLLKIFVPKRKINVNDIIDFNNIKIPDLKTNLKINDWYYLWSNKVDYLEYQISQIGKKYPLIRESFSYYIGLAENAIYLVKNITSNNLYYGLSHRRISFNDSMYDLYNPLNFVFDLRIRDVCEYFKSSFFNDINIIEQVKLYLFYNKFGYEESCYFMSRMLFPTYYFDVYEKIINNEIDESYIKKIISKALEYEKLLAEIHLYLKMNSNIPDIEWIKKVIQH